MKLWASCLVLLVACGKGRDQEAPPTAGSSTTKTTPAGDAAPAPAAPAEERWAASLVLPTEIRDFVVTFAKKGDAWTAKADILGKTFDLTDVAFTADTIKFTLGKREVYELYRKGDTAGGVAKLGAELPFKMARLAPGEKLRSVFARPQTPKPPFPYEARDVEVTAPDGGKLAGTMTVPQGTGPFPAVLLVSGSGQQDRDETIFGHKPYLILSDKLTRAGFVTVRYDDRSTGKTVGPVGTLDTEIADDAAWIEAMKGYKEVDPKRLGIVGHSTGGMIAPHIAVKTKAIAFIVSLAGVAIPGRDLVPLQMAIDLRAQGATEDQIKAMVADQTKVGEAAAKDPATVKAVMVELAKPKLAAALGHAPTDKELDDAIARGLAEATAPWTVSYFRTDPRVAWKQLSIPVLLVVGDKDTQVPADITVKELEGALTPAARPLAKTVVLPGLNHLFQHAKTGRNDEYALIEESFDPATADLVTAWLVERARPAK